MGWSGGSDVMTGIIKAVKKEVPDENVRETLYVEIVDVLRNRDWDTLDECVGLDPVYDRIYEKMYPEDD